MTAFNYIEEAHVTASPNYHADKVEPGVLLLALQNFIDAAETLDVIKKSLFYGRDLGHIHKAIREDAPEVVARAVDTNIIHGIIGIATEAGELVEALVKAMFNDADLDVVNMAEEVGDVFWYAALLAKKAGVTFDAIQRNNIEKLRKRFPDKFSEFDANNRDLDGEREILESLITLDPTKIMAGKITINGNITLDGWTPSE